MTAHFCSGPQSYPHGIRFIYAQCLINSSGITHICMYLQISGPDIPCVNTYKQKSRKIICSWKSVASASGKIGILRLQAQCARNIHTMQTDGIGWINTRYFWTLPGLLLIVLWFRLMHSICRVTLTLNYLLECVLGSIFFWSPKIGFFFLAPHPQIGRAS